MIAGPGSYGSARPRLAAVSGMNCATPAAPAGLVTSVRNPLSCHNTRVRKAVGSRLFSAAASTIRQIASWGLAGRCASPCAGRAKPAPSAMAIAALAIVTSPQPRRIVRLPSYSPSQLRDDLGRNQPVSLRPRTFGRLARRWAGLSLPGAVRQTLLHPIRADVTLRSAVTLWVFPTVRSLLERITEEDRVWLPHSMTCPP